MLKPLPEKLVDDKQASWSRLRSAETSGMKRQKGMAALLVIFVVAMVTVLVAGMYDQHYIDIRRTSNILGQDQGKQYSIAAETYARVILKQDWDNDQADKALIDHEYDPEDEPWGQYAIQIPIDTNVGIQGQIDDLSGKFNLNSLVVNDNGSSTVNKDSVKRLEKLLGLLDEINPELSAEKFVDWIDLDDQIYQLKGAEDETYLLKEPPYRTANSLFNDISELWLIDGMTQESYDELKNLVAVLPNESNLLNINTAPSKVLAAYVEGLSLDEAETIVEERESDKGFKTMDDFLGLDAVAGKRVPSSSLKLNTEYFEVRIKSVFNDRVTHLVSLIYRDSQGNSSVLRRDFGKKSEITKQVYIPE